VPAARVRDFQNRHRYQAYAALAALKDAATSGRNVFAVLMDAARVCTLQQITEAFFEVGGEYRRNVCDNLAIVLRLPPLRPDAPGVLVGPSSRAPLPQPWTTPPVSAGTPVTPAHWYGHP
jgi:hypothetical protein